MLKIRLKRYGRKKKPSYRIVVIDSRKRRDGQPIEEIGFYDPINDMMTINFNRWDKYLTCGAQASPTTTSIYRKLRLM